MNTISSYKVERLLGQNINQARTTYLCSDDKGLVVIKQFGFKRGGNWSSYKDLEKEFNRVCNRHSTILQFSEQNNLWLIFKQAHATSIFKRFIPNFVEEFKIEIGSI